MMHVMFHPPNFLSKYNSNPDTFVRCVTHFSTNGDNALLDEWLERFRTIDAISNEDLKGIVIRALDAEENYNLLLIGPPASSKTLFLQGIPEMEDGVYFDATNTTNRILDVLEEKRPRIICIDELDKIYNSAYNIRNYRAHSTLRLFLKS
jgi:hypothetical protein